jgi:hypothetical protein
VRARRSHTYTPSAGKTASPVMTPSRASATPQPPVVQLLRRPAPPVNVALVLVASTTGAPPVRPKRRTLAFAVLRLGHASPPPTRDPTVSFPFSSPSSRRSCAAVRGSSPAEATLVTLSASCECMQRTCSPALHGRLTRLGCAELLPPARVDAHLGRTGTNPSRPSSFSPFFFSWKINPTPVRF